MKKTVNQELRKERNDKIKQFLKDMIAPTIFVLVVGIVLYKMATYTKPVDESRIPDTYKYNGETDLNKFTLESGDLKFVLDPATTQFTVYSKKSDQKWESNPDITKESISSGDIRDFVQSLIRVQYSNRNNLYKWYDSYPKSVAKKNYLCERVKGDNGQDKIVVHFSIGDIPEDIIIPPVAKKEEFEGYIESIRSTLGDYQADDAKGYYDFYDKDNLQGTEEEITALKERYPALEEESLYIIFPGQNKELMQIVEGYFKEIGYDRTKYEEDCSLDLEQSQVDTPIFNVDLEFEVVDNKLKVSVPFSSIQNVEEYPITKLSILPFFGAGSTREDGYLFVPEGGGALINFNNNKNTLQSYSSRVYGWDLCLIRKSVIHDPVSNFGVFGIANKTNKNSFICVPGDGASYCTIQAEISVAKNPFNFVYAQYDIYQREQYELSNMVSNFDIYKYIEKLPEGEKIEQTYIFIPDSDDYTEMAKAYEKSLKETYGESYFKMNTDATAPMNVEIIGAADKTEQILGIPISSPLELTNFDEAGEIVDDLNEAGFKNVNIKYTGWCNGGVNQKVLSGVKPVSKLGGKSGLKTLSEKINSLGYHLSLNGITMLALDSNLFDGFFSFTDAAKNINEERMELHKYSAVTFALRENSETFYLLHTYLILKYADNLVEAANSYNAGVSFEDIGDEIPSDFWESEYNSRESVRKKHIELLKKYKDAGTYTVINAGNDYAVPYVDLITNMDLSGSNYTIIDENIPFFELALHGYINYTGESLNICGDYEEELLYSAAYGAGLSFTLMNESAFTLQDTLYTHYYGCDYSGWKDRMIEIYSRYNKELGKVFNQRMTGFRYVDTGVSCTEYSDGTKVYVNFNHSDRYVEDGDGVVLVKARDYKVS